MKVLKFYTKSIKTEKVERIIWYINDRTFRSNIIKKVENYLSQNSLICIMDIAQLYLDRIDFEKEENKQFTVSKDKIDYLLIGCE